MSSCPDAHFRRRILPPLTYPGLRPRKTQAVWVHDFIQPVPSDSWEGVQEILKNRQGDCKQYAILLMWILNEQFGMKSELVGVDIPQHGGHAVVHADGCWYDPTLGYIGRPKRVPLADHIHLELRRCHDPGIARPAVDDQVVGTRRKAP